MKKGPTVAERIETLKEKALERATNHERETARRDRLSTRLAVLYESLCKEFAPLMGLTLRDGRVVEDFACYHKSETECLFALGGRMAKDPTPQVLVGFTGCIDPTTSQSWYQFGSQKVTAEQALDIALTEIERRS